MEETITLVAAVVAAVSGLASVALGARRSLRQERDVWRRGELLKASVALLSEANELRRIAGELLPKDEAAHGEDSDRIEAHDRRFHETFLALVLVGTEHVRETAQALGRGQSLLRLALYNPDAGVFTVDGISLPDVDHFGEMVRAEEAFIDACREALTSLAGVEPLVLRDR